VLASTALYLGLIAVFAGMMLSVKSLRRLRVSRQRAAIAAIGVVATAVALVYPASESRTAGARSRIDEFVPVWQFQEFHSIRIASPPTRVFDAIKRVRPDEILLFRTLIWIRAGFQPPPQQIRDATSRFASLIDVATQSTFVYLADDAPREFVVGTLVGWEDEAWPAITPAMFQNPLPLGASIAAMNFLVTPDGDGGSIVSTETRVFANSASARRRFAVYWRVIYPGSAIIRRMWLRAVKQRATSPATTGRWQV